MARGWLNGAGGANWDQRPREETIGGWSASPAPNLGEGPIWVGLGKGREYRRLADQSLPLLR